MTRHLNQLVGDLTKHIVLDGLEYTVEVSRKIALPPDAPRVVVVSYLNNSAAVDLLQVCVQSIQRYTPEQHELWVVDNNSPLDNLDWLLSRPDVNLALNRTEPVPPEARATGSAEFIAGSQSKWGSYANAIGLETAAQLIDPQSCFLMCVHMDALPCRVGWLRYMRSKITGGVAAAGVRMDRTRTPEGVLHVLGYMVDFQLFRELNLDFFPELPQFDVGDRVTVGLRDAGHEVFACRNTVWQRNLVDMIPSSSPLKELPVDRALDDDGNVIFLHLGRGVRRSLGEHQKGISAQDWVRFVRDNLLISGECIDNANVQAT